MGALTVGVLGPLRVHRDGEEIALRSPQQRRILVALALAGAPLRPDVLQEILWGDRLPASADGTLQAHVSRLRSTLGRDEPLVSSDGDGYRLLFEPQDLDANRFRALLAQAAAAATREDPTSERDLLQTALSFWRGPPLIEFCGEPFVESTIARLEAERLDAIERRLSLDLDAGLHAQLGAELKALLCEHPYRESLHGLSMVALYRSGRQADALAVAQRLRVQLRDELGLVPCSDVLDLEHRILVQDPDLLGDAHRGVGRRRDRARPVHTEFPAVFRRALAAAQTVDISQVIDIDAMLARGAALRAAGHESEAREVYAAATRRCLSDPESEHDRLAEAALGLAGDPEHVYVGERLEEPLVESAIRRLFGRDPITAQLRARLAVALVDRGEQARGSAMAAAAVDAARHSGDRSALAYALRARRRAWWHPADLAERVSLTTELRGLGEQLEDPTTVNWAHRWRAIDLIEAGDLAGFEAELDVLEHLAARLHQPFHWWGVTARRAGLALLAHGPARAEPLTMEALALAAEIDSPFTMASTLVLVFLLRRQQGRLPEIADAILDTPSSAPAYAFLVAALHRDLDDRTACSNAWEELASDGFERLLAADQSGLARLFALASLADTAWYLDDPTHATRLAGLLRPYTGRLAVVHPGLTAIATVDHALGQLAVLDSDPDADCHLDAALAHARSSGARLLELETLLTIAERLTHNPQHPDAPRRKELLGAARHLAQDLGVTSCYAGRLQRAGR